MFFIWSFKFFWKWCLSFWLQRYALKVTEQCTDYWWMRCKIFRFIEPSRLYIWIDYNLLLKDFILYYSYCQKNWYKSICFHFPGVGCIPKVSISKEKKKYYQYPRNSTIKDEFVDEKKVPCTQLNEVFLLLLLFI